MNYDDEEYDPYAGFGGEGCSIHGEDYMRECSVCGEEFCMQCFPGSDVCEECAAQGRDLDDDEDGFGGEESEEMKIVAELAPDDPELDQETEEALKSFGDLDDESAPSDDVFQEAEKRTEAVAKAAAAKKAPAAAKASAKPKGKAPKKAPGKAKKK
jgi:hypothetical protein